MSLKAKSVTGVRTRAKVVRRSASRDGNICCKRFITIVKDDFVVRVLESIVDAFILEIDHVILHIAASLHALALWSMEPAAKRKMEVTIFCCPEFVCPFPEAPTSRPRSALDKVNQVRRRSISIRMALQHGFI